MKSNLVKINRLFLLSAFTLSICTIGSSECFASHKDWRKTMSQGRDALAKDDYETAISKFQMGIEEAKKVKVEDHLLAKTYGQLARAYKQKRDFDKAEDYYRKALAIRKTELGDHSEATLRNLEDLSYCLWSQRKYQEVSTILEEMLAIKEKSGSKGIDRPLELLARISRDQHRYKQSNQYLERLLSVRQKELGKEHIEVEEIYEQMARNYREQGKLNQAIEYFKKVIKIHRRLVGKKTTELASKIDDLAHIYMKQLNYKKATPLFEEALEIRKSLLPEQNVEVLRSMQRLSYCYERQNRIAEAKSLVEAELAVLEKSLGSSHIDVAKALSRLARLHIGDKKYSIALKTAFKALELRRAISSDKDASLSHDVRWIANLYARQGNFDESLKLLDRQEKIVRKLLGKSSTEYIRLLKDRRSVLQKMNRDEDAKKLDDEIKALESTS